MDSDFEDFQEIDIDKFLGKPSDYFDKGLEFPNEINLQIEEMINQQTIIQPQLIKQHNQSNFDIEKFRQSVAIISQQNKFTGKEQVSQSQKHTINRPLSEQNQPKNPNELSKKEDRKVQEIEGWGFQRQDVALAFRERFRKLQKKKAVQLNAEQRIQKFRKFA